jgi:hypothetical protein
MKEYISSFHIPRSSAKKIEHSWQFLGYKLEKIFLKSQFAHKLKKSLTRSLGN